MPPIEMASLDGEQGIPGVPFRSFGMSPAESPSPESGAVLLTQNGQRPEAARVPSTSPNALVGVEQGGETAIPQEIASLKRDLASLKKQAEKRHKPWYLDPSKTIPIFISVVTVAISIYSQRAQDVQKDLEALSETIGQMVDLRKENTEKMMSGGDPALLQAESVLLNQKKLALQEKAKVMLLDPKVRNQVSSAEIRIFATELGYSGEVKEAEQWLRSALLGLDNLRMQAGGKESKNEIERVYVLRGLAYWEMVNDRTPDALAKGRQRMVGSPGTELEFAL